MRKNFRATPIRQYDSSGNIIAAGLEWIEVHRGRQILLSALFAISFLVMAFAIMTYAMSGGSVYVLPFVLIPAVVLSITMYLLIRDSGRRNAMLFRADGVVEFPESYLGKKKSYIWDGFDHAKIVSIELISRAGDKSFINVYTTGGDTVAVAQNLTHNEAFKVDRQLNLALQAIRQPARHSSHQATVRLE